jgi:H+/Cl- antiporter ClcA
MDDREIIGGSDYIKLILWVVVMAVPAALLTVIYLALYNLGGELVAVTIPAALNISRPVYTILVATLGGLLVGLGLRYLGVRHGESLPKEMEAGRVPYQGVPGFVLTALVGLVSGASLLVGSSSAPEEEEAPGTAPAPTVEQDLAKINDELAALRQLLKKMAVVNNARQQ